MSARTFHKGQRVRMTPVAVEVGLQRRSSLYGVVTSEPTSPNFVNVRRDGQKTSAKYAAEFWTAKGAHRG